MQCYEKEFIDCTDFPIILTLNKLNVKSHAKVKAELNEYLTIQRWRLSKVQ